MVASAAAGRALLAHARGETVTLPAAPPGDGSFFGGVAGVAWLAHVCGQAAPRLELVAGHDIVSGLAGVGIAALSIGDEATARVVVEALGRSAAPLWTSANGRVDLGLAHGAAGPVVVLAAAARAGIPGARPVLDDAVEALLAHVRPHLPAFADETEPTRLAWCYGELGVAAALLTASEDAGEPSWAEAARELGRVAAARPHAQSGIVDAGLCHGAAGAARLFARLGLSAEAEHWRAWAADDLTDDGAVLAFGPEGLAPDDALLTGATGVELALLADGPSPVDVLLGVRSPLDLVR